MAPKERFALAALLAVALMGHAVRIVAVGPSRPPGGISLLQGLTPADPAAHRALSDRIGRPLADGELIDLNRATAPEIARLPRIGMGLAKRLVNARTEAGGFAGIEELNRVPGVGPGLLAAIRPHLALADTDQVRRKRVVQGTPQPPPLAPLILRPRGAPPVSPTSSSAAKIRVNSATSKELERLPGIGPAKARAIVAYRQTNGPFASVSDLEKVPGISRRLVAQLAAQVALP